MAILSRFETAWVSNFSINNLKQSLSWENKNILIVGKGPTLIQHQRFQDYFKFSITLNHACEIVKGRINHFTDIEALNDCSDTLLSSQTIVVMPIFPHIEGVPTATSLPRLAKKVPILERLIETQRIYVYAGSNAASVGDVAQIELRYFSIEAAYQLACYLGAQRVMTLGVDGGSDYSHIISSRARTRLLENGRPSFDSQFRQLAKLQRRFGVTIEPLMTPLRIFVGATETELIPFLVLKHSIEKRTSFPTRIERLPKVKVKLGNLLQRPGTKFSLSRFLIPSITNFSGRALYLDSDMLVFSDIAEIFHYDMKQSQIAVTFQTQGPVEWVQSGRFLPSRQFSVMLIDCAKTTWDIQTLLGLLRTKRLTYEELLYEMKIVPNNEIDDGIPPEWNSLENYSRGRTKLLHFTNVPSQPWRTRENQHYALWLDELVDAIEKGIVSRTDLTYARNIGGIGSHILSDLKIRGIEWSEAQRKSSDSVHEYRLFQSTYLRVLASARNTAWRITRALKIQNSKSRKPPKKDSQRF